MVSINRKCPISAQSKSCRLKTPSILKPAVPKPFRFQTEERSILKVSNAERTKHVKVKDGDLIRNQEKKTIKTNPTITQPFQFRTEERSILKTSNAERTKHVKVKDGDLICKQEKKTIKSTSTITPFRFRTEERSFVRAAQAGQSRQLKKKDVVVQKQEKTPDEKLSTRITKIEPENSVVEKVGTEDEEAKKDSIPACEETDEKAEMAAANKVSSAMIDRIDCMLQKLKNETDDGDWRKSLDRGYVGRVPPEEVAAEAMYLKDALGKVGAEELVNSLSKDTAFM